LSQIFRSFKANSTAICRKRAGNLAKLGFSAVDHVKSDRLLAIKDLIEKFVEQFEALSQHTVLTADPESQLMIHPIPVTRAAKFLKDFEKGYKIVT